MPSFGLFLRLGHTDTYVREEHALCAFRSSPALVDVLARDGADTAADVDVELLLGVPLLFSLQTRKNRSTKKKANKRTKASKGGIISASAGGSLAARNASNHENKFTLRREYLSFFAKHLS